MQAISLLKLRENKIERPPVQLHRRTFHWLGKPPAMPVEVSRKKALASSIERSELLTSNLAS